MIYLERSEKLHEPWNRLAPTTPAGSDTRYWDGTIVTKYGMVDVQTYRVHFRHQATFQVVHGGRLHTRVVRHGKNRPFTKRGLARMASKYAIEITNGLKGEHDAENRN